MGRNATQRACDKCRRRFLVLAPSRSHADVWRQENRLAPRDLVVVDTDATGANRVLQYGLRADDVEVVLLDGWRRGRYAERLTWELASAGFDFSAVLDAR